MAAAGGLPAWDLSGRRVLAIGGGSGIGEGAAKTCRDLGASVIIASRSSEKLAAASERIGAGVEIALIDVTSDASVEAACASVGEVDHVVLSAAQGFPSSSGPPSIRSIALADARALMNSKFWGAYRVARFAQVAAGGSLTFVSGAAAARVTKGRALQTAVNAALEALTKGLAAELAPVRVNTVSPGFIETPLWGDDEAVREIVRRRASQAPVGRAGTPADVALQIVACMVNTFMTGSVVYVEGGYII